MKKYLSLAFLMFLVAAWVQSPASSADASAPLPPFEWSSSLSAGGRWAAVASSANGSIAIAGYDLAISKVRITRDGGATWAELAGSPAASWNDLAVSDDGSVMVLAGSDYPQSSVWVSTDGGVSFERRLNASPMEYRRLAISSNGQRILVASSAGVLLSTNSGVNFSTLADITGTDVAMTSDGATLFAAQYGAYINRSTDDGATWTTVTAAGTAGWTTFDVSGDGKTMMGVVSYDGKGVRVSNDFGATFSNPSAVGDTFAYQYATGALSADGRVLIAVSYGTAPMVSTDGGATWSSSDTPRGWLRFAVAKDNSHIFGAIENGGVRTAKPVPPPTVTYFDGSVQSLGGSQIAIYGTNFVGVTSVTVGGVSQSFTVVSKTLITLTPGPIATPEAAIVVTTASGSDSTTATVAFPGITSLSHAEGPTTGGVTGGAATLDANGNFYGLTVTSAAIGGVPTTATRLSASVVRVTVPPGVAGTADVVLETSAGQLRLDGSFTYYALVSPALASTTPSSTSWAGGLVTLTGAGLGDATVVTVAGKQATIGTRSGRNEIQIQTPAALVGLHDLVVTNPVGSRTFPKAIRYTWERRGSMANWAGLGGDGTEGVLNGGVYAITTMPNGDIIVGGSFYNAGGIPEADYIARWNGSVWSALGSNGEGDGYLSWMVHDLAVEADGSIIAVGEFTLPGGDRGIARFSGGTWSGVAGGVGGPARAVAVAPNGDLYVGGIFANVGGIAEADFIVRWRRQTNGWKAVGSNGPGYGAMNGIVRSLAITADGVIAGGHFSNVAGIATADRIARWNGTSWSAIGSNGAGDGKLPDNFVTTAVDIETIDGGEVVLAAMCRNGGNDGSAYLFAAGQWTEVSEINLNKCVRDAALLPDGRAVLAGWFGENLPGGDAGGLVVGSDATGWESLGTETGDIEALHIDAQRNRMFIGANRINMNGDPTADYFAMADTKFLERNDVVVDNPGTITVASSGGSTVTLTGSGFGSRTNVTIGDSPLTAVTVVSPTRLSFVVPAGLSGSSSLAVYSNRAFVSVPNAIVVGNTTPSVNPPASSPTGPAPTTPSTVPTTAPSIAPPAERLIESTPPRDLPQVPSTLSAGSEFMGTFRGFTPDGWVYAYFASKPRLVGTARADSSGAVELKLSIPNLSGRHSFVLYDPIGGIVKREVVTIERRTLPATGSTLHLLYFVFVLFALGLLALTSRRTGRS